MAGDCTVVCVPFTCSTSAGGTVDITRSGLGSSSDIKAALFFVSRATSTDTLTSDAMTCIGATDFTRERCIGSIDEDAAATSDNYRWMSTGKSVRTYDTSGTKEGDADATAITNGVRLTFSNPNSCGAYLGFAVIFAGADVSAYAGTYNCSSGTDDVTDPGFEPDLVFSFTTRGGTGQTPSDNWAISFGVALNDAGETQLSINDSSEDGKANGEHGIYHDSDASIRNLFGNLAVYGGAHIESFDANGFSAAQDSGSGVESQYLAVKLDGVDAYIWGFESTPTDAGTESYTGCTFTPQFCMTMPTYCEGGDIDTHRYVDPHSLAMGVGAADGTAERCLYHIADYAAATMNSNSYMATAVLRCEESDEGNAYEADLGELSSDTINLEFSTVPGTAFKFGLLAIEENQATGTTVTQTAVQDIEVNVFAPTVNARTIVDQGTIQHNLIQPLTASVNDRYVVNQGAIQHNLIQPLAGDILTSWIVDQGAVQDVQVGVFDASVGVATVVDQTAVQDIQIALFDATLSFRSTVSQQAVEDVQVQVFAASTGVSTIVDQGTVQDIQVALFNGEIWTSTYLDVTAEETIQVQTYPVQLLLGGRYLVTQQAVQNVPIAVFSPTVHPIAGWAGWACHKEVVLDVAHDADVTLDVAHDADVDRIVVTEQDLFPSCGTMTTVDFTLYTSTDRTLRLTVKDGGGGVVDISLAGATPLSAATWIMQKDSDDTTDHINETYAGGGISFYTDGTDGILDIDIAAADTASIDASNADLSYYHQLQVTVDSLTSVVAEGTVTIKHNQGAVTHVEVDAPGDHEIGIELPVGTLNVT